jgi:hypothetical protein
MPVCCWGQPEGSRPPLQLWLSLLRGRKQGCTLCEGWRCGVGSMQPWKALTVVLHCTAQVPGH